MRDNTTQLFTQHAQQLTAERLEEITADSFQQERAERPLSDMQLTALDLYERGFNVIPLKPRDKKPYLLQKAGLFAARLHHCAGCHHSDDITDLFAGRRNVGIITGRTSGNLLDIDCDTFAAFDKMGKELTARAIPFWAVKGCKGGSYLVRVIEGEVINIPKRKSKIKDVEFFGNRHIRVMPPSIHPTGIIYQWATPEPRFSLASRETIPAVSIAALAWTGLTLVSETRKQWQDPDLFGLPQWAALLSYNNRQNFAGPVGVGDRNRVLTSFAYDAVGNAIEYSEVEPLVLDYARRVGLSDREAIDTLKSAYSQEREPARKGGGGLRAWQRAKAFAESFEWRADFGRQAATAQAVFMACIQRARMEGREHWRASVREVAELANCNKDTARMMLSDLQACQFIKRTNNTTPQERSQTAIYKFSYDRHLSQIRTLETTCSYSVRNYDNPKTQAEQDVFYRLGRVAWRVWRYLQIETAPSVNAIAKALELSYSSVYSAVGRLQHKDIRLVARGGDGHYYAEPKTAASLQYLAAQMFNGGSKSQDRKTKHRIEREREATRRIKREIARIEDAAKIREGGRNGGLI